MADTLRIIPLGGVGEVGKNITVIEADGRDPGRRLRPGVPRPGDARHRPRHPRRHLPRGEPRPGARRSSSPTATRTTPAALPYVLPQIPGTPIYATRLTEGLVQGKLREHKLLDSTPLHVVEPGTRVRRRRPSGSRRSGSTTRSRTGSATRSRRRSARSSTPATSSSTTPRPTAGAPTSGSSPRSATAGVEFLLSDSTRAEKEGYTLSEATVGESLNRLVGEAPGPGDRGDLRQQHRPRPAGDRRRLGERPQDGRARAKHGAEHGDRPRARLSRRPRRDARAQGPAPAPAEGGAGRDDHRLAG